MQSRVVVGAHKNKAWVALERFLFVFPKLGSTLEFFLMQPLEDQKVQRCRNVWVGQADFSRIAQRKQKSIKNVNCMFAQEN